MKNLKFLLKLSVAVIFLFALVMLTMCRPDLQRMTFKWRLKQRVSPEDLQAWAMNLVRIADAAEDSYATTTNLHPALRGLFFHEPFVDVYGTNAYGDHFVSVSYGGAIMGHWGVEIGPTNRALPPNRQGRRYTYWAPGVSFFDGR
jgi:hypothetical protein